MKKLIAIIFVLLAAPGTAKAAQPNLLFVLTDDQRRDTLSVMPATRANFDYVFKNGLVTTPLCCPSRASILTGEYAVNHGVTTNGGHATFTAREADSLAPWLQAQGYYTGLIGKYQNKYFPTDAVPPGWDEFHAWVRNVDHPGDNYTSFTLRHHEAGRDEVTIYEGTYSTRLFASLGARFIRHAHDPAYNPDGKPWALFAWTTAPHAPSIAEDRYTKALVPPWQKPPSFKEADMSDKPREIRSRRKDARYASIRTRMLRTLLSVDDLVDRLWNTVDDYGERENTWGIFSSDNGIMWGEHWLAGKGVAYEESIGVPFRFAVPGQGPGRNTDALVANIDIAPTLLELAGGAARPGFDGQSLISTIQAGSPCLCARTLRIEHWVVEWAGLRTRRWKYVRWPSTREELYDLRGDPYELVNKARAYPRKVAWFRKVLEATR